MKPIGEQILDVRNDASWYIHEITWIMVESKILWIDCQIKHKIDWKVKSEINGTLRDETN